jgi:hypothetical protein
MEELILSDEEKKLIKFLRLMKKIKIDTLLKERKSSSSANPSQVSICVTEDLNMGEKIGG